MTAHRPQRTCVGCRHVTDQQQLLRFVQDPAEPTGLVADPGRRSAGRGAWLHPDPECARLAVRRGGFSRAFRSSGLRIELDALLDVLNSLTTDGESSTSAIET